MRQTSRRIGGVALLLVLGACAAPQASPPPASGALPAGAPPTAAEPKDLHALVDAYAAKYDLPPSLVHRVVRRESEYRPEARNGPHYGMMQIRPDTARAMGFRGAPADLLDAETNLRYAVRYLRGAWLVAEGDEDAAVSWYSRGYYYAARERCLLVETGLSDRERARHCR